MITRSLWLRLMAGTSLILIPSSVSAQSLTDAVRSSLQTHPTLEAAQAAADSALETRREAKSDFFPEFSTSIGGGRVFGDNSTSRGLVTSRGEAYSWLWEGSASLTQNFFNGFETTNRVDAAAARESAAGFNVADARETLALRAAQAYLSVLRSQAQMAAIKEYQAKIDDYLVRVQDMVEQGGADESEAAQARNVALILKDNEAELEGQLKSAIASYQEVVGNTPGDKLVKPSLPMGLVNAGPKALLDHAKQNHPALKSIEEEMQAAAFDIDAEGGTILPSLDGELSYLKRDQKEEIGGELTDARAMMRASWDIALGGGDFARVRKAKADYAQNQARAAEKTREIERDIKLAYAEMETAKKQYDLAVEREKITTDLLDAYNVQFEGAKVRLLQLMQSENQVFGTKLDKMDADFRVTAAQVAVLASAGRLQETLLSGAADISAPVVPATPARESKNIMPEDVPVSTPVVEQKVVPAPVEPAVPATPVVAPSVPQTPAPVVSADIPAPAMVSRRKTEYDATSADKLLPYVKQ